MSVFRSFPSFSAVFRHAALCVTSLLMMAPFIWMVSTSLKSPAEIFDPGFSLFPKEFNGVENYARALTASPLLRFLANGVFICASIFTLQVAVCLPAAYALAKKRFRCRQALFGIVLICLMLPHQVLAIPLFLAGHQLGVMNSYTALIFPFIVSPFGIFLLRQFIMTVPDDLIHAARLDGLSETSIVWRVIFPIAAPAVAAFGVFSVVSHWNDLFWPLIAVQSQDLMTPPVGVAAFRDGEAGAEYGPLMAGATIIVAPLLVCFLFAQRWFIEGLSAGAVK